jgi:hypothetical protein
VFMVGQYQGKCSRSLLHNDALIPFLPAADQSDGALQKIPEVAGSQSIGAFSSRLGKG